MKSAQTSFVCTLLVLSVTGLGTLAWMLGIVATPIWQGLCTAGVAAGFLLGLGLFVLTWRRWHEQQRALTRRIDAICQAGVNTIPLETVPELPQGNPYQATLGRVRQIFQEYQRRLQELGHAQTAKEVRFRRMAGQVEQIKTIFASLPDPILAINDYDDLVLTNPSAVELFRLPRDEGETHPLRQILPSQKLADLMISVRQRKASGSRSEEVELPDPDGEMHWYRATASKLAAPATEEEEEKVFNGAVMVLRNVGDQNSLQKRNAEFIADVSHEMKTPLAGIKAYVELLVEGEADDAKMQEEYLAVINSQADRLQRLVENLLNLARIEAGVVQVNKRHHPLNEILEEALRIVQPSAEAKNITLVSEPSAMHLGILADRDMLLQTAINLLANAVKYTPSGGTVMLRSRMNDKRVRFEVQDTGVGLDLEECQRVFEKFYRVKKNEDMAPGTGLGLPLAKHIVEDVHGGQLTVMSELGAGSTFVVELPSAGNLRSDA